MADQHQADSVRAGAVIRSRTMAIVSALPSCTGRVRPPPVAAPEQKYSLPSICSEQRRLRQQGFYFIAEADPAAADNARA